MVKLQALVEVGSIDATTDSNQKLKQQHRAKGQQRYKVHTMDTARKVAEKMKALKTPS